MSQATEFEVSSAADVLAAGEAQIHEIENKMLQGIFSCRTSEAVEAAITYARFLSTSGITPENYPVFLQMLEVENHWVIDALIGNRDPFLLLSSVLYWLIRPAFGTGEGPQHPEKIFLLCALLMVVGVAFFFWRLKVRGFLFEKVD